MAFRTHTYIYILARILIEAWEDAREKRDAHRMTNDSRYLFYLTACMNTSLVVSVTRAELFCFPLNSTTNALLAGLSRILPSFFEACHENKLIFGEKLQDRHLPLPRTFSLCSQTTFNPLCANETNKIRESSSQLHVNLFLKRSYWTKKRNFKCVRYGF